MKKPFWSIENDYLNAREKLDSDCHNAKTLLDAVKAGASMTCVNSIDFCDEERVGYLNEDGTLELQEGFTEEGIKKIKIAEFDRLERDEDGNMIAYFIRKDEDGEYQ